jgi:hypothetical protein
MTLDDVLARLINHELLLEEAKYVKNLSKGIMLTKRDDMTLQGRQEGENKVKKGVLQLWKEWTFHCLMSI